MHDDDNNNNNNKKPCQNIGRLFSDMLDQKKKKYLLQVRNFLLTVGEYTEQLKIQAD